LGSGTQEQPAITLTTKTNKTKKQGQVSQNEAETKEFTIEWSPGIESYGIPIMADLSIGVYTPGGKFIESTEIAEKAANDEVFISFASIAPVSNPNSSSSRRGKIWEDLDEDVQATLDALLESSRHDVTIFFLNPRGSGLKKIPRDVLSYLRSYSELTK